MDPVSRGEKKGLLWWIVEVLTPAPINRPRDTGRMRPELDSRVRDGPTAISYSQVVGIV